MGKTQDLGRRIEICASDRLCHGISIALYRQYIANTPQFLVHTYSDVMGAAERIAFIRQTLIAMLGMEPQTADVPWLQFPCKYGHDRALRRAFLDLCRLPSNTTLETKPLTIFDKKAACQLTVAPQGRGKYSVEAEIPNQQTSQRVTALARGFAKLCDLDSLNNTTSIQFPCGEDHHALIGILMYRAQHVRASMREQDQAAGRGVLAPPSQQ